MLLEEGIAYTQARRAIVNDTQLLIPRMKVEAVVCFRNVARRRRRGGRMVRRREWLPRLPQTPLQRLLDQLVLELRTQAHHALARHQ